MNFQRVAIVFKASTSTQAPEQLKAALAGTAVLLKPTTAQPGSAYDLARQACDERAELVIAVGGDGTVCQVARGLLRSGVPMAVFPQGTGNLFARTFYPLPGVQHFAGMLKSGMPQPIDMVDFSFDDLSGKLHRHMFMVMTGMGTLSDAVSRTSAAVKARFGKLAYTFNVLRAAFRCQPNEYRITANGVTHHETGSGLIAFNVIPPNMIMMGRGANPCDGLIDVGFIKATSILAMSKLAVYALLGRPEHSGLYRTLRASHVRVETRHPVNPNIDGDPSELTCAMDFRAMPGAVKMILAA